MMTIDQLIQYAKDKGIKYEIHYPQSRNNKILPNTDEFCYIGIEFKNHVWYWWRSLDFLEFNIKTAIWSFNPTPDFRFFHRYNQINGTTIKAFSTGFKAENIILEHLKKLNDGKN